MTDGFELIFSREEEIERCFIGGFPVFGMLIHGMIC